MTLLTVAALRAFLAAHPGLPGDLPIMVGGRDFDDANVYWQGLADEVWTDAEGHFGGRLCIGAMGLGLASERIPD